MATTTTPRRAGQFRKVGENSYRYSSNEIYYAVFRVNGKLIWKSDLEKSRNRRPGTCQAQAQGRTGKARPGQRGSPRHDVARACHVLRKPTRPIRRTNPAGWVSHILARALCVAASSRELSSLVLTSRRSPDGKAITAVC